MHFPDTSDIEPGKHPHYKGTVQLGEIKIHVFFDPQMISGHPMMIEHVSTGRRIGGGEHEFGSMLGELVRWISGMKRKVHNPNCPLCQGTGIMQGTNSYGQTTPMACFKRLVDLVEV